MMFDMLYRYIYYSKYSILIVILLFFMCAELICQSGQQTVVPISHNYGLKVVNNPKVEETGTLLKLFLVAM
jgi:hypothetical protein